MQNVPKSVYTTISASVSLEPMSLYMYYKAASPLQTE